MTQACRIRLVDEVTRKARTARMSREDRIWSRYSDDKIDIGNKLGLVIRTLNKVLPLGRPLRALSIGSNTEPQFRLLEATCRGGIYLLDIDAEALDAIDRRVRRQHLSGVRTVRGDYTKIFADLKRTRAFVRNRLDGRKVDIIILHHSLYYCPMEAWRPLFDTLYREVLAPQGAMHAVMMAPESADEHSTTWLYNHFVGRYFGCHTDQDLRMFADRLRHDQVYRAAQIHTRRDKVLFFVNDFKRFMAVVWMILLYPDVHRYTMRQRREIAEFVYAHFWKGRRPLIQEQDHLIIYRGIGRTGLA